MIVIKKLQELISYSDNDLDMTLNNASNNT